MRFWGEHHEVLGAKTPFARGFYEFSDCFLLFQDEVYAELTV